MVLYGGILSDDSSRFSLRDGIGVSGLNDDKELPGIFGVIRADEFLVGKAIVRMFSKAQISVPPCR